MGSGEHQRGRCPANLYQWATAIWHCSSAQLRVISFVRIGLRVSVNMMLLFFLNVTAVYPEDPNNSRPLALYLLCVPHPRGRSWPAVHPLYRGSMESCTWGILQHCKQKIHPKESDFGVLSYKFFLTAMTGSSCLCAWLFCSTAHWDCRRQVLAAADAGKCCFLRDCSLSHQVLLRVGLDDKIYKIQHLPLFLSSLSLACECISPCCKDFRWHQARTGGVSQPQITSSDLFISFSPAACLLPFLVFFYSLIFLFQLFFAKIFYQSISKLFVTVLQRTLCTLPFPFFFSSLLFFSYFLPKTTFPLKADVH